MNKPEKSMDIETVALWVGGKKQAATGNRFGDVTNPATGAVARKVPLCNAQDIANAVAAARTAFPEWRATPSVRRARILTRFRELLETHRQDLTRLITEEHGKTLADAAGSLQRGIEVVEFAAGVPHLVKGEHAEDVGRGIDCHSMLQPVGVCAGITPFNFPVMVPLWMFPVAIACGNTFVLKPSEKVPSASMRMAELFKEAGLPDGVFNVVHGDKEAVDALLAHPGIGAISFVGSTPIARYVYETCARNGKRVQALGGAKNHAVVLPDADLDFTADALLGAAYGSAGERCMAISAVVAVGDVGDVLVEKIRQRAARLPIGPGDRHGIEMGPLITHAHRDKVASYIDKGASEGARLVLDGRGLKVAGHERGFFLGPSLFDHVTPEMTIYRDEIFGPVLVVLRANTLDDAIKLVNSNPYGNGTAIFTRSGGAARRFQNQIE
ncbi:MAG TPA: CoA-acylating methylmalonate-semialdehyde dehydrogenase, partial [Burkholderiales bacterium]|nr:CoA-acylating methylmalonate-semialdehyde dehydrogenase [Burkholderiales bacterium]